MMVGLNIKDDLKRKRALLLHYAGEEINDIFETLPDTGEENNYQAAIDALTAHFAGKILIQHFQVKCSWNKIYILSRTVSPLTIARASTILFLIELFPSSITNTETALVEFVSFVGRALFFVMASATFPVFLVYYTTPHPVV